MANDIVVQSLSKCFGERVVLDELSVTFPVHSATALMGESGCGKTTLLRIIAGLEPPSGGSVSGVCADELVMVFQEARLLAGLNARDNLVRVAGVASADAERWLVALGFAREDMEKLPAELSGGMQRRVALARAFARGERLYREGRTPLLLFDEAIKELDAGLAETARRLLLGFRQTSGCTLLMVTHEQTDAEVCCERILTLADGKGEFSNV